jgi:hypothetical protein
MDKRSICQPRQARDKEFYNWSMTIPYPSGLKMRCAHFFGCVVFILNTTMRRCAVRARAQPLPLYLSTILYTRVRPASFLSRSLSLLARTSAYLLCESSSPRVLSERGCFVPATGRCITYNKLREYTHTHTKATTRLVGDLGRLPGILREITSTFRGVFDYKQLCTSRVEFKTLAASPCRPPASLCSSVPWNPVASSVCPAASPSAANRSSSARWWHHSHRR